MKIENEKIKNLPQAKFPVLSSSLSTSSKALTDKSETVTNHWVKK